MVGDKQVAELALRRCARCGRLLAQDPGVFTRLLDLIIMGQSDNFCHALSGAVPPLFVCVKCLAIQDHHRNSRARRKTK